MMNEHFNFNPLFGKDLSLNAKFLLAVAEDFRNNKLVLKVSMVHKLLGITRKASYEIVNKLKDKGFIETTETNEIILK